MNNELFFIEYTKLGDLVNNYDKTFDYVDYYSIKKGDSLYKIAKEFNVNPVLLALINGIDMQDYIYPNQLLMIPKENYSYYISKDGDTLSIVSDTFGVSNKDLLANNPTVYLKEGQLLVNKKY